MDGREYQRLCSRTECDQVAAMDRMSSNMIPESVIRSPAAYGLVPGSAALMPIRLNHGAFGIAKEAGEILSLLERVIYYGKKIPFEELQQKIKDELGDVLWYAALVANAMQLDLSEVMEANIRKLKARYPEKYTQEAALERDRAREAAAVYGLAGQGSVIQDGHGFGHAGDTCEFGHHDWVIIQTVVGSGRRCRICNKVEGA